MDISLKIHKFMLSKLPANGINYVWAGDTRDKFDHMYLSFIYDIAKHIYSFYCHKKRSFIRQSSLTVTEKRPVPLQNIGLNCYLNSSFQSIVACTTFTWEMKELEKRYPRSKTLFVFNKILASLNDDSGDDVELSKNPILRNWNKTGEQEDSFEILSYVLFQVFHELRKVHEEGMPAEHRTQENWNKVRLPMMFLLEFRLQCGGCGHAFQPTMQTDTALHLTVPPRLLSGQHSFSIEQLIDNYFVPDPIADFSCSGPNCQESRITKTIVLLRPAPSTICLHIHRSFWNSNKSMKEKINEKIDFRETLWLKEDYFRVNRSPPNGPITRALSGVADLEQLFQDQLEIQQQHEPRETAVKSNIDNVVTDDVVSLLTGIENSSDFINVNKNRSISPGRSERISSSVSEPHSVSSVTVSTPSKTEPSCGDVVEHQSPGAVLNGWPHSEKPVGTGDVEGRESRDLTSSGPTEQMNCQPVAINVVEHAISPPSVGESTTTDAEVTDFSNIDYSLVKADCQINGDIIHNSDEPDGEQYCLRSVIVHIGNAESGHYICYRKCGPKWFCTNDNFVTEVSFAEVQSCQAYILMYEKPLQTDPPHSFTHTHTFC